MHIKSGLCYKIRDQKYIRQSYSSSPCSQSTTWLQRRNPSIHRPSRHWNWSSSQVDSSKKPKMSKKTQKKHKIRKQQTSWNKQRKIKRGQMKQQHKTQREGLQTKLQHGPLNLQQLKCPQLQIEIPNTTESRMSWCRQIRENAGRCRGTRNFNACREPRQAFTTLMQMQDARQTLVCGILSRFRVARPTRIILRMCRC